MRRLDSQILFCPASEVIDKAFFAELGNVIEMPISKSNSAQFFLIGIGRLASKYWLGSRHRFVQQVGQIHLCLDFKAYVIQILPAQQT